MKTTITLVLFVLFQLNLKAQNTDTSHPVTDSLSPRNLGEVIISASRVKEYLMKTPVSIEKVNNKFFASSDAPSFFDALENVKNVQMITPSLGFRIINTRGFANTTNVRFAQLVDGMDIQSPHIGAPIGNALGPSDLDVDNAEIIPGVGSAMYGINSINGLINISTRNPFTSEGISVQQKTGIMHLGDPESPARAYTETSFRVAQVLSPRLAIKINGSFNKGYDWIADNRTDLNPNANSSTKLFGADNPALDPANGYGNESSDRKTIQLQGKSYVVARTGYAEKDVVDYTLQNIKGDAGVYYKLKSGATVSYLFHMALLDNVYQRANRFRLQDYFLQQHGVQYESRVWQAKVYYNNENTGHSYNLRSMAENMDRNFKPDNVWYADYTKAFNNAVQAGNSVAQAHHTARDYADAGRYLPGTPAFNSVLNSLKEINNWDVGAALKVKASFIHAETQVNLTEGILKKLKENTGLDLLAGLDHRTYIIVPDGNYFINPAPEKTFDNLLYSKTGGFLSATRSFLSNKLKLGATLRTDKNDYFPVLLNPRLTAVYSLTDDQSFRLAYQNGYRYPSIFEAYSNINSGGVKRVGGLPAMSHGIFENAWLQTSISAFQSAVLKDLNNGMAKPDALNKEKNLLVKNPYTYIQPEHINSLEGGYKGFIANRKLLIDVDFYFNIYHAFIAQANMNVPKTTVTDSIPYMLYDKTLQNQYRMWTNSRTAVYNYGFSAGITWDFGSGFRANANATYAKLIKSANEDGLEDGFNTPQWMVNLSLNNDHLYKTMGAGISYRWQSAYYWQSFLVNGDVPAYSTVNAHVGFRFQKINSSLKIGAGNLLNRYYYSFLGGPQIGGSYYCTFTWGLK
jgi:iron complex outermembrane receptor protein